MVSIVERDHNKIVILEFDNCKYLDRTSTLKTVRNSEQNLKTVVLDDTLMLTTLSNDV